MLLNVYKVWSHTHSSLFLCLMNICQVVPAKTTDQVLSPDTCATKQVQHTQNIFLLSGLTKLNWSPAGYCQLGKSTYGFPV